MNTGMHQNSVRKNNFLSLMKSYERNYYLLKEMIDFRIFNKDNISKYFTRKTDNDDNNIRLTINRVTNHTAEIKFSYSYFKSNTYIDYISLKIYFDSKQVEILNFKKLDRKINYNNIQKFHDIRLKKWYKNYFLHLWIKNCLKKGYSFGAYSKV